MFEQLISHPAPIFDSKPQEKFTPHYLRGAQDLWILLQGANLMDPKKNALHADLLEYEPE